MASIFAAPSFRLNLTSRPSLIHRAALPSSIDAIQFHSNASPFPSFRYRNTRGLELRQRSFSITASNSSDGNSIKEENGSSKASTDAQGSFMFGGFMFGGSESLPRLKYVFFFFFKRLFH
ncbi:uncharacterized protein LOC120086813 isoform X2 [Benincasa hispida]|uniref:uncharacterized protein LOC120086813 isoform X2 n=1 Tax=Benincasa hispida TaxID=102211 RepID=UPI001900D523|nr:uncharacterized protein LOC120086813 isoform X2 [Benincasa hispida]